MDESQFATERWTDTNTRDLLVNWAKWARGKYLPTHFHVECGSLESDYLPDAGEVLDDTSDRLSKALAATPERFSDRLAVQIEVIVMNLPVKSRDALRLHYVIWRAMPIKQKRRILGVTEDGYNVLVYDSGLMVRNILRVKHKGL